MLINTLSKLLKALEDVKVINVPIRQAAGENNIFERTLRFRFQKNNTRKDAMRGKQLLGEGSEKKNL